MNFLRAAALAICLLPRIVQAEDFVVPALSAPVVDQAGVLTAGTKDRLDRALSNIRQATGLQLAVLIVPNLSSETIEQTAIRVVDAWQLGTKDEDNGALLMLAMSERKIRIEVGQGLEGVLTDALSKRIIDERITPLLRANDADGAVTVALYSMAQAAFPEKDMSRYFSTLPPPSTGRQATRRPLSPIELAFLALVIFFALFTRTGRQLLMLALLTGGRGRGSYRGGSSYRGGGGGFSGGGSSGGW